ncbi:hypothetical protein MA16_Dca006887 [Dendrobium catenatum]|uniref:Uncharacterized protein n=1 Tax=Dendrobium catenatum TaxID=906689 RepID=A0A2I0VT29_9ASPA|nr:hypothetical protein MA16_Dca006887 [Dendrobium catenatum]
MPAFRAYHLLNVTNSPFAQLHASFFAIQILIKATNAWILKLAASSLTNPHFPTITQPLRMITCRHDFPKQANVRLRARGRGRLLAANVMRPPRMVEIYRQTKTT